MKTFLFSLGTGTAVGLLHNLLLKFAVYRAVSCYYASGCRLSTLHSAMVDVLYFPAATFPAAGRQWLLDLGPDMSASLLSMLWAVVAGVIAWAFVVRYHRRQAPGNDA